MGAPEFIACIPPLLQHFDGLIKNVHNRIVRKCDSSGRGFWNDCTVTRLAKDGLRRRGMVQFKGRAGEEWKRVRGGLQALGLQGE